MGTSLDISVYFLLCLHVYFLLRKNNIQRYEIQRFKGTVTIPNKLTQVYLFGCFDLSNYKIMFLIHCKFVYRSRHFSVDTPPLKKKKKKKKEKEKKGKIYQEHKLLENMLIVLLKCIWWQNSSCLQAKYVIYIF